MYGGIEAGGTKFICAVAASPTDQPEATLTLPTTTPDETLGRCIAFFEPFRAHLKAIGVASFGPIDLHRQSPTYGFITTTPKPGWHYADVVGPLRKTFGVPVGFDTDVNGAALGELRYGGGQGAESVVYFTIGTGIGGGAVIDGRLIHGLVHPEMGHLAVRRHPADTFEGQCPYHQDCLEGMACGPAIKARWGRPADELPSDHPAWEFEAYYLAQAAASVLLTLSPEKVIFGGGVMHQPQLFPLLRKKTIEILNGYVQHPAILERIESLIIPPGLGDRAGITGALELAHVASIASI